MTNKQNGHLTLVHSIDDKTKRFREAIQRSATAEFGGGTFQSILARETFLLEHCFEMRRKPATAENLEYAREMIVEFLQTSGNVLLADAIDFDQIQKFGKEFGVNLAMTDFWAQTPFTQLPFQNFDRIKQELSDYLFRLASHRSHREEIEQIALKPCGLDVLHEHVTRILLYQINRSRMVPRILVLPNVYKPYDPFVVLLEDDRPFPADVARLMQLFSF